MSPATVLSPVSAYIWETKYRFGTTEASVEDTWRRVARALASVETSNRNGWEKRFFETLADFRFLPGGRILAGAGTGRRVTLFNCFVMGAIEDSMEGIFNALKEGAITMQQGGGVGYDFSTLRPRGAAAQSVGTVATGPVSFMHIWDSMCATIVASGARRGAMMGVLRCDHPDIEEFIEAKRDPTRLRHFNLSVLVTDAFMQAVLADADWPLVFPPDQDQHQYQVVKARALWQRILRAAYDCAEPGVIFIDRVNQWNNLWYCERISATNPCGEIPLPPYGACDLGSINLVRFVREPFTPNARMDFTAIEEVVTVATRMLDNVHDLSHFPLQRQAEVAHESRRLGLGITGLADALIMLGIRYGEPPSFDMAAQIMWTVRAAAYGASIELARHKGVFPRFVAEDYLESRFIRELPLDLRAGIKRHGLRNSHLTAIAPAGTISLLANNVSSGLEPVFRLCYSRRFRRVDGGFETREVTDYAHRLFEAQFGAGMPLTDAFVTVAQVPPEAHLEMQARLQGLVDNAISKTINLPVETDFAAFQSLFERAYSAGLKGCTAFRPNPVTGEILLSHSVTPDEPCCPC